MNSIYLHRDDLMTIIQFMDRFPGAEIVEVTSDTSSGIGAIIDAHLHHVDVHGLEVKVTKNIVNEESW